MGVDPSSSPTTKLQQRQERFAAETQMRTELFERLKKFKAPTPKEQKELQKKFSKEFTQLLGDISAYKKIYGPLALTGKNRQYRIDLWRELGDKKVEETPEEQDLFDAPFDEEA